MSLGEIICNLPRTMPLTRLQRRQSVTIERLVHDASLDVEGHSIVKAVCVTSVVENVVNVLIFPA